MVPRYVSLAAVLGLILLTACQPAPLRPPEGSGDFPEPRPFPPGVTFHPGAGGEGLAGRFLGAVGRRAGSSAID